MKILVYSHDSAFYGAPKSIFELTNELRKRNYDVVYIIPGHGKVEDSLSYNNYEYYVLPNPSWVVSEKKLGYSRWYYFKHIVKSILGFIVAMHNAYKKHIEAVKKINPDLIIVNTSVAPLGLYVAKRLKINSIIWVREPLYNKNGWKVPTLLPKGYVGRVLKKADVIMGPSEYLKNHLYKTFGITRMHVLPNIVDYVPVVLSGACKYTFGLVGSIAERKGQLEFFEAMIKNMPDAKLIVYGTGTNDYAKKLFEIAEFYPENIKMYGYESDLDIIYSSFDIYVNMGIDETFGRTTVEAMRARKLVFGRRSGATPEIIKHGENGFLFDNVDDVFDILKKYDTEEGNKELQMIRQRGYESSLAYMPNEIAKKISIVLKG